MRVRPDRGARGIGHGVYRRQDGRRRLPDLSGRADGVREAGRGRRRAAGRVARGREAAAPALPAGLLDERAEPEGGAVLRVVLPAVRVGGQPAQGARVPDARRGVRRDEHGLEQHGRVGRRQRDAALFGQAGREEMARPDGRQRVRRAGPQARDVAALRLNFFDTHSSNRTLTISRGALSARIAGAHSDKEWTYVQLG
ncbi:protein of unknown function [Burkholderia multivorans]